MKNKILLVEDEEIEMAALRYSVETQFPGLFEIIEAADGEKALSLCIEYHPEIIVVDLNIPGITGMELIEKIFERSYGGKILITTAYDYSEYVRKAMKMGVIGYILKPLDMEELKQEILRCIDLLEETFFLRRKANELFLGREAVCSYAGRYLIHDILQGKAPENTLTTACGWPKDGDLQICILRYYTELESNHDHKFYFEKYHQLFSSYFSMLFSPEKDGCILLMQFRIKENIEIEKEGLILLLEIGIKMILKEIPEGRFAVSRFCNSYQDLCREYTNLHFELKTSSKKIIIPLFSMGSIGNNKTRVILRQKIIKKLIEKKNSAITDMLKKMSIVSNGYWPTVALFLEALHKYDENYSLMSVLELFLEDKSFSLFSNWINEYVKQKKIEDKWNYIEKAMEIMRSNFDKPLSLDEVSEELGLSSAYFSWLFKQKTGKKFISALNDIRIEYATFCIVKGETDMQKLANDCGYTSKKYFFEAFHRVTGKTITQIRKELEK